MSFIKNVSGISKDKIQQEVKFQRRAAAIGLSPNIISTDNISYIEMEKINQMCIADMYGEAIENMPQGILKEIYDILVKLYLVCDIAYIDVTPYNFIENDGKVWVIDFGDARNAPGKDEWLDQTFRTGKITSWNPEFR